MASTCHSKQEYSLLHDVDVLKSYYYDSVND